MIIETHVCPGCGTTLPVEVFACRADWARLPVDLRRVLADPRADHDSRAQAEAGALRWYESSRTGRTVEDHERPYGTRRVDTSGTTHEWTGIAWRLVPRSELDREAWQRSREQR